MKNLIVEKKLQASDVMFSPEENFSLNAYMTDSIGTFYVDCYTGAHFEFNYFKYAPDGSDITFEGVCSLTYADTSIDALHTSNLDLLSLNSRGYVYILGVSRGSSFAAASETVVDGATYYVARENL